MTKTQYEKIANLLQLEKNLTNVLEMIKKHNCDIALAYIELGRTNTYWQYWLDKDTIDFLCKHYKSKLDSIHNELKELGYYD